ncbi:MAG: tyrosine-type recombinase/integrase [Armatimonadota bacterium]|jgi:site-specific recombinase XerD
MELTALADDFTAHITHERQLSPNTVEQYNRDLRRWMKWLGDNGLPLDTDDLDVSDLRGYVQYLSGERDLSAASVRKHLACLRTFFKFSCQYHGVQSNLAAAVATPKLPERLPEVLTDSEVARMLEACDLNYFSLYRVRDRAILAVLCTLGLRRQELMDIRLEDWDAEERTLRIKSGKGDKERMLPLTDELISLGERWLEVRPECDLPWFFVSRARTKLAPNAMQKMIRKIADLAGLDKRVHLHMFRHYAATAIVQNRSSGGMEQARRILGHASTDSLSVYLHLNVDDLRPAVEDNARRSGIRGRTTVEAEGVKVDPGTELAAKRLQGLLDELSEGWQSNEDIIERITIEWTRHLVAEDLPLSVDAVRAILTERSTVEGLSLDEHLAVSEVGGIIVRRLNLRDHAVEQVLEIGEELKKVSGRSASGNGVKKAQLLRLNSLLPKENGILGTIAGVVAVASNLQTYRMDIPCGRQAMEIMMGLLTWDRGLPPLIVPAGGRNLWRLLLDRASSGDTTPCVAWCVSGQMATVSSMLCSTENGNR